MAAACSLICESAIATEGGGNSYPVGVDNNHAGMMMPEGANWLLFYQHYNATHFKDNGGHDNPKLAEFHLGSNALAPRLSYVWPGVRVFGANVETRVVQPILSVDLDMRVARPAPLPPLDRGGNKSGLADVSFSPVILGWHWPSFHHMFGLETHLKTGAYSVNDPVNIGRNYYQFAPNYAFTWFPAPDFDVSAKFRYGFNTRNTATNYQSGDEASIEFSSGYRASSHLSLGVNGYFYLQTTDDIQNGVRVNGNGNRGRVTALGPYVSYQVSPSLSFSVKAQIEFAARNRPQGTRIWALARMHF